MDDEQERDARLGFRALLLMGSIPPPVDDDDDVATLRKLRRLVLSTGSDTAERRRIVDDLDKAIRGE